jgi:hypothetical protein
MIFNIANLDDVTCIKKFEVPLQVANRTYRGKTKRVQIWISIQLELGLYCNKYYRGNIVATVLVGVLQCPTTVLVFFAPANYRVLWITEHTMIYPASGPFLEIILKMNRGYKGWAENLKSSRDERGEWISNPLPEG